MALGVSYIDGTTYIYDLLYEESTITVGDLSVAQALLLSIKLGVEFDYNMDDGDDGVRRWIRYDKEECEDIIKGEYENFSEKDDLAEFLIQMGRLYFNEVKNLETDGDLDE
ncbi:MAG: hypothetical protein J6Y78_11410 [Paludibacteraceae bacterium]|nr:hypothetical protein [Paludibacteraceae bacterium]